MKTKVTQPDPVDPDLFRDSVNEAVAAFATDVSYAVAIARAAVTIIRKRAIWQARREIRAAEALAHAECKNTPAFECHAESACGTGDCKFARGELAQLRVPAGAGTTTRPQQRSIGAYRIDDAATALANRRT